MSARGVPELQQASVEGVDIYVSIPSRLSENGFGGLDCCLSGSVVLVIVRAADRVTDSPDGTEFFECPQGKLGTTIHCQPYWNAFLRHPFLQQADDLSRCDCAATGTDGGPAREVVGVHQKVLARQLEEVGGSALERARRRRFDQEGLRGVGGKAFCACRAASDHAHCEYRL